MDKKNIVKKFMKDMEQRQNEFSMALSDCIGAVDAADAAIKVVVMEQYCEVLKAQEPENFDPAGICALSEKAFRDRDRICDLSFQPGRLLHPATEARILYEL